MAEGRSWPKEDVTTRLLMPSIHQMKMVEAVDSNLYNISLLPTILLKIPEPRILFSFSFDEQEPLRRRLKGVLLHNPRDCVRLHVVPFNISSMTGDHHAVENLPIIIQLYVHLTKAICDIRRADHRVPQPLQEKCWKTPKALFPAIPQRIEFTPGLYKDPKEKNKAYLESAAS